MVVHAITLLPSFEEIMDNYTHPGYENVVAHEGRRRDVYKFAHDAYLMPIMGDGVRVVRCGPFCKGDRLASRLAALAYLNTARESARGAYLRFSRRQQDGIELENSNLDRDEVQRKIRGFLYVHIIGAPPALPEVDCNNPRPVEIK